MSLLKKVAPINIFAACLNLTSIFSMVALIFFKKDFPPLLPLWFSFTWGPERLAKPELLWLLPILSLVFFLLGSLISKLLSETHAILAQILVWTTAFLSLVFLISVYKIILLTS